MEWKLYIHTNKRNGKRYIGITSRKNVNQRWQNGRGYETQLFGKAIQKYGWDGFMHEVIACGTEEEIKTMEDELIKKYRTQDRRFGYNVKCRDDYEVTKDIEKKIKEVLKKVKGKKVYRYEIWGDKVKEYEDYMAVKEDNFDIEKVKKCCQSKSGVGYHFGYRWSYKDMTKKEINSIEFEEPLSVIDNREFKELMEEIEESWEERVDADFWMETHKEIEEEEEFEKWVQEFYR